MCACGVHAYSLSAITLQNTLVILSTVAPDAGRYYAQAVNDKNGENKTSQPIILTVESKYTSKQTHLQIISLKNKKKAFLIFMSPKLSDHDYIDCTDNLRQALVLGNTQK